MSTEKVLQIFTHDWGTFYFTLGRGRPTKPVDKLYYAHKGVLLGHFDVQRIARNDGSFPKLRSLSDEESEWQIKPDAWVALCRAPFHRLEEKLFHDSFRGWRYFDLDAYRGTLDAKVRI